MHELSFYVFSYNRGSFLANCVHSIEAQAPGARVVVIDDHSDDAETLAVLEALATRHRVIRAGADSGHKLGGLYSNMQTALELTGERELACFLQDDTQLVRALSAEDLHSLDLSFEHDPQLGFVSPAFVRGASLEGKRRLKFDFDEARQLFFARPGARSAGVHYSDIFLTRSDRLRAVNWQFQRGEPANAAQAEEHFSRMGYLRCPFVMWLPNGPAYRGKTKTLALRWAERRRRCGFYPFRTLEPEALLRLHDASPAQLPVAEEFLRTEHGSPPTPWVYDPLQGAGLLKHANRAELLLRRLFGRRR